MPTPDIPQAIAQTLVDPSAYADHRIYDAHRWLRKNLPLGFAHPEGYDPFHVVTRHADVLAVSRQNDLFHNGDRSPTVVDRNTDDLIRSFTGGSPHLMQALIHLDAPEHLKVRALTQTWFMPGNLKKIEARIRRLARTTVERMLARGGRCDFVNDVALQYPLHVVMEILGVPEEDEALMLKLSQEMFAPLDPDLAPKLGKEGALAMLGAALHQTVATFGEYFGRLSAQRRAEPRDDVLSVIANARIDGKPLSPQVELGYCVIIASAGHDTTSSSTAGAIWALAERPQVFRQVRDTPALIPSLVDEAIRWTTPVKTFMRTATVDTSVAGRPIAKGDWLMLCYASANRDELVFEEPDTFRVDRPGPPMHLAFGNGAHLCLGQHLARLEMRILYEELLPKEKSVRLDGEPRLSESFFVNGLKALPIRFELA